MTREEALELLNVRLSNRCYPRDAVSCNLDMNTPDFRVCPERALASIKEFETEIEKVTNHPLAYINYGREED